MARPRINAGLKRKQYEGAMGGNVTMLIWMGKNYLGQSDKYRVNHGGQLVLRRHNRPRRAAPATNKTSTQHVV